MAGYVARRLLTTVGLLWAMSVLIFGIVHLLPGNVAYAILGEFALPAEAPYDTMRTVSVEARQKLAARRPATLAQASSIPGVSPADLQNLVLEMERWRRA